MWTTWEGRTCCPYLPTSPPVLRSPGHMALHCVWGSPSHTAPHHAWQGELMESMALPHLTAAMHKSSGWLQCHFASAHQHGEWEVPATLWGTDDIFKTREEFYPPLLSLCPTHIAPAIRVTKIIQWHHLSPTEKHKPHKFLMEISWGNRLSRLSMPRKIPWPVLLSQTFYQELKLIESVIHSPLSTGWLHFACLGIRIMLFFAWVQDTSDMC